MDFLNHRVWDMVFYQVFLLSPLQCTVETVRGCLDFVQEFGCREGWGQGWAKLVLIALERYSVVLKRLTSN